MVEDPLDSLLSSYKPVQMVVVTPKDVVAIAERFGKRYLELLRYKGARRVTYGVMPVDETVKLPEIKTAEELVDFIYSLTPQDYRPKALKWLYDGAGKIDAFMYKDRARISVYKRSDVSRDRREVEYHDDGVVIKHIRRESRGAKKRIKTTVPSDLLPIIDEIRSTIAKLAEVAHAIGRIDDRSWRHTYNRPRASNIPAVCDDEYGFADATRFWSIISMAKDFDDPHRDGTPGLIGDYYKSVVARQADMRAAVASRLKGFLDEVEPPAAEQHVDERRIGVPPKGLLIEFARDFLDDEGVSGVCGYAAIDFARLKVTLYDRGGRQKGVMPLKPDDAELLMQFGESALLRVVLYFAFESLDRIHISVRQNGYWQELSDIPAYKYTNLPPDHKYLQMYGPDEYYDYIKWKLRNSETIRLINLLESIAKKLGCFADLYY